MYFISNGWFSLIIRMTSFTHPMISFAFPSLSFSLSLYYNTQIRLKESRDKKAAAQTSRMRTSRTHMSLHLAKEILQKICLSDISKSKSCENLHVLWREKGILDGAKWCCGIKWNSLSESRKNHSNWLYWESQYILNNILWVNKSKAKHEYVY